MKSPVARITLLTAFVFFGVWQPPAYGENGKSMKQKARPFVLEEATVESVHVALANKALTLYRPGQKLSRPHRGLRQSQGPALRADHHRQPATPWSMAAEMDRPTQRTSAAAAAALHSDHPQGQLQYRATCPPPAERRHAGDSVPTPTTRSPSPEAARSRSPRSSPKPTCTEFARSGTSISCLGGQILNPYDLTRTPGGSSGGTGAAIAANFGVLGTGSDTGQSIRSPASANSLVGVRPTRGLVSRAGVIPNSPTQDETGPITRTVKDAARLLDVMAGYDPDDPITAFGVGRTPASYTAGLKVSA